MDKIKWLEELIAFDTTSRHSNLALIDFVQASLSHYPVVMERICDPIEPKANLLVSFPNAVTQGGLMLSGHTDVVPVDGQVWASNPFKARIQDDRVYGRGACDMKGFIAVLLSLVPTFAKLRLKKPLYFVFSYDEETGCRGAKYLVEALTAKHIKPDGCIVGEPSNMEVVIAHKGIQVYRCKVLGLAAHSSLTTKGCNAIEYAAEIIYYIRQYAESLKQNGPFDAYFDVPFTSISTNLVSGGNAYNTIPAYAEFSFEFRHLPQVLSEQIISHITQFVKEKIEPRMQSEFPSAKITFEYLGGAPAFSTISGRALKDIAYEVKNENRIVKVAYGTEAGFFQQIDIPTIVCGPGRITEAHKPDEFIEIDQLAQCENFLLQMVQRFCL